MHLKSFILDRQEFEKKKVVNKFMLLERALNLLNSKTFWFANPEEWNDPFEKGSSMLHMVQTRNLHGKVVCSVPVLQIIILVKLRGMHILRMNRVLNFLLIERSYYNSLMTFN